MEHNSQTVIVMFALKSIVVFAPRPRLPWASPSITKQIRDNNSNLIKGDMGLLSWLTLAQGLPKGIAISYLDWTAV